MRFNNEHVFCRRWQRRVFLLLTITLLSASPTTGYSDDDLFQASTPLPDNVLARLRGGFVTRDGVEIDIGIERLVFINDTLESSFIMDLTQIGRREQTTGTVSQQMQSLVDSGMLNIIQNTLNGQKIGNLTALDVNVKNLSDINLSELGRAIDIEMSRSLSPY